MSQENAEAGRQFVDAVNRGDRETVLRLVHPEVVFEPLRAATEGAFEGREGVDRFLTDTAQTFEVFQVDLGDLRVIDSRRILGTGTIRVRGRGSGVETDIPTAAIAEYRNGLLWRYKDYGVAEQALEAAGLSEQDVEIVVNRWAEAFNRRDMQALLDVTTTDFEFTPYLANLIETTTYQGHDGLRKYFADADSAWEGIQIHLSDVRAAPDNRVFAAGELQARGRASGAEVRVAVAWAAGVRENKLAWASTFDSEAEALDAAGLKE